MNKQDLATFLRGCRTRLRPSDVGFPAGLRRRTPGLRREELAELAGLSVSYCVRLEQARAPQPSAQVLSALARALELSGPERDHLFRLAGQLPPPTYRVGGPVESSVLRLLDQVEGSPVRVINHRYDILAWNRLAGLLRDFSMLPVEERNFVWLHFRPDGAERGHLAPDDFDVLSHNHVAQLRIAAAEHPKDHELVGLIRRLRSVSAEFTRLWDRHDVRMRPRTGKRLYHPALGALELTCDVVLTPDPDQRVLLYSAASGSSTARVLDRLSRASQVPVVSG